MADSPSKRRKTSPTTSIPVDASNTPSRIPIPSSRNTPNRRPSFASPTKASLSRHNPQLLRPSSSGASSIRPGSRGRDLQDVFAKALAENRGKLADSHAQVRDGSESATTTQENDPPTEILIAQNQGQTQRATTPKMPIKSVSMSGKSRRMSRSPVKRPERPPVGNASQITTIDLLDDMNPFQKKGLRRSPPADSQQPQHSPELENIAENPFKKTGLRRSPITSQATNFAEDNEIQQEIQLEIKSIGHGLSPVSSQLNENEEGTAQQQEPHVRERGGLRRSPIISRVTESVESISQQVARQGGLRRSPISSLPLEQAEFSHTSSQQETHLGTQADSLRSAPVEAQLTSLIKDSVKNLPLAREQVENDSLLEQSPIPPQGGSQGDKIPTRPPFPSRTMEQGLGHEIEAEQEAEAQLEAELRESNIYSDPAFVLHFPEVVIETDIQASKSVTRLAQNATSELLRATSRHEQVQDRSSKVSKAPKVIAPSIIEDIFNPFMAGYYEEPELPLTPSQRGIPDPVVTTPSSSIQDTPSKRARKRKTLSEKHKSSPLKPRDRTSGASPYKKASQGSPTNQAQKLLAPKEQARRRRSSRFIAPIDRNAAKRKKRDDLLHQLQQLQADVALANRENERIRLLAESKKKPLGAAPNAEEILQMLLRSTMPEPLYRPAPKTISIMKSMDSFLPFRPRRKPIATPIPNKLVPSHLPISLDEPLPYLQAFSPLSYSSNISLLPLSPSASDPSADDTNYIMQRHVIDARHPSGLFVSRLAMTVDSSSLAITAIDVLRLDMNAEVELGTFIRARARASGPLGKDITVVCYAMGRWAEVSIQRARLWCAIEKEFGTSQARATALQKRKKRKRNEKEDYDEDQEAQWTRRQLLPNIGRTSLELKSEDVELRFEWKIGFDYTGEVESDLAADARIPEGWQDLDDRKSLTKVPETFDRLVRDRGPMSAMQTLIGLLM